MLVENTQVVLLIVFTHLVVAVFLLSIKSGNRLSNNILGCLLLITALDLSNFVFPAFYLAHLNVDMTRANTALFIAPTIYFYIRSVIHNNFQFKRSHLWHTLPFVFASLILIPRYYGVDTEAKLIFYQDLNNKIEIIIIGILAHSQLALYLIASFKVLSKHRKVLVDHVSDPDQLNTTWLLRFLQVYSINFLFVFIRNTIKFTGQESTLSILTSVMLLVTLCLSIWVLFQALRKPELFKGIDSSLETSDALIKQIDNKPQNEIHDNAVKEKIATLREHMTTHKPYLEPTLTIEMLADDIGLTVSDLSFMINRHLNQHFFDLINEYRIHDAAMQLSDPELSKKTVLDILYDVGFNSKSSFNTAFKKQMHMTPTQYRQSKTVIA